MHIFHRNISKLPNLESLARRVKSFWIQVVLPLKYAPTGCPTKLFTPKTWYIPNYSTKCQRFSMEIGRHLKSFGVYRVLGRVAQNKKWLETQLFQAKVAARTRKLLFQIFATFWHTISFFTGGNHNFVKLKNSSSYCLSVIILFFVSRVDFLYWILW